MRKLYRRVARQARLRIYVRKLQASGRLTSAVLQAIARARAVTRMYSTIIYIAGPLTGVSDECKERYCKISKHVERQEGCFGYAPHLHGTDPVEHPDVTPGEVRDIDFLWAVVVADMHINCLHPAGHGNAIEEGWAEMAGIPVVYLAPVDLRLSRLVMGMRNIKQVVRYPADRFDSCLDAIGHLLP